MEETNRLSVILKSADDKKAFDIKLLDITELTTIAKYFVICSGNSDVQVKSIADEIEEKMFENGLKFMQKEGHRGGRWIILDYNDIIVHVFHKEERSFYNLDKLWIDSKNIDIDNYI